MENDLDLDSYALTVPLHVVCLGGRDVELVDELVVALAEADLVVGLGDVDLDRVADVLPDDKPALCVLGDRDARKPPPLPFHPLHGTGVSFRGWRIAGLSGGVTGRSVGLGFTLDENEAMSALRSTPPCDILLSHAPPAGFEADIGIEPGLEALTSYVTEYQPLYHFHTNSIGESSVIVGGHTLVVGVEGALIVPPIDVEVERATL